MRGTITKLFPETNHERELSLESVFIGGHYRGCILPRGCMGFESFDHLHRSLGTYQSRTRARAVLEGEEAPGADC
jgi:hypothetical protein